ncbi:putative spermidine/putrescine transport system substrate-binding protein [Actinomadura meyerae]|uniref:Putative spermidine/putrescine transport system substrate-binding protein n=2 Tax=Actinomadura meyerae TaxID=240840 RepID=A0A239MA32_9ACTN|nr:putative spermidine/putrescine transport system substrate-binding protein [Actinomadura meyerae]
MKTTRLLAIASAAGLAVALSACGGGSGASDSSLTVTMWGGAAQKAHVDSYFTPWAKTKNVTIKQDSPTDYAKIKAQVEAGKVSWGPTEVEPNFANTACAAGLLEKLPQDILDKAKATGVAESQLGPCAIPILQYSFTIAYNSKTFSGAHPTTWAEFFDTQRFPGKRGFWKYATGGMFEAALLADGVKPDQLYPLDIDRAFRKLESIKRDIVFFDTGDQMTQMLASGEAPLVQAWSGRIFQARQAGEKVANEWKDNLVSYDQIVVPKGYPNKDLAFEWMRWFLDNPKAQAADAEASIYGPASEKALDLVPEAVRKELPGFPANAQGSAGLVDYGYWAENYDGVTERLNAWIAK